MKYLLPIFFLGLILASSCNKDRRSEDVIIADFIAEKNLDGEFVEDGIYVAIENPGNGAHPTIDDKVEVYYEGVYTSDSELFDSSLVKTVTFPLAGVIRGWQKGIPYFGVGEKGWLILPASQGYGNFPPQGSGIRNNASLAFWIELVSIQ